jgi:putative ABC transport system permease protein
VLLILGLELVKDRLADQLQHELPEAAPTAFFVNIQPQQWSHLANLLVAQGATQVDSVPVVTARLRAIDEQSTADLVASEEEGDRRWALTREQRLTYMKELPADNKILSGELWSHPDDPEVSVEEDFASELGVEVGSRLRFDLQGVPLDLLVTSIRSVEWTSFGINFYLVVEPGVLEEAPHQRVATARLPLDSEQEIQDLVAARFPNVTLLKIREILEQLATVLGYLARGVSFIGAFTAIAGIVILAGGISADSVRRRRHIALLKTLGMTQGEVAGMLAVEFTVIGAVAGMIGSAGGSLLSWAVITRGLELEWSWQPATLATAIAITLILTATTGILSSRRALRQPPAVILRGD